jgi:hypothetical protein
MGELQEFVANLMERHGAAVEPLTGERLEVMAPEALRGVLGWPELVQLRFGQHGPREAIAIGLEGDWLERFGALLGENGRWAEREFVSSQPAEAPSDPERVVERAIELPNAVWRLQGVSAATARLLALTFRYSALSDEKREGLLWLGLNLSTGAAADEVVIRLRSMLSGETQWQAPGPDTRRAAGSVWEPQKLQARVRRLLGPRLRTELEPFINAARRRMERDRVRVRSYHCDLWTAAMKRLSVLNGSGGEKAHADRQREQMRLAAIEREYRAKLDDLRHNYAMRVTVQWVQGLELYLPVQRFEILIRRRKGERRLLLDWHPAVRLLEPPPCEWGSELGRVRLVCDDKLHLTEPAGQEPCQSCAKPWCRACSPGRCPRCRHEPENGN